MNSKEKRTGSFDDLPMSLNADDISSVLNISIGNAYNLLHREDFPTIHIGKRMVVPRDRFFAWIEKQYADRGDEPYSSLDQLPLTLNADDIAKALNISRGNAYTLLHREDFPTLHIGKRLLAPRDRFLEWMQNHVND